MGCGSSSAAVPTKTTSIVPSAGEKQQENPNKIKRRDSGTDIQLKEALVAVFDNRLVMQFASKKGRNKSVLTRLDFLDKVFPTLCVGILIPPPTSPDFIVQSKALFLKLDTNANKKLSSEEFSNWYLDHGHDVNRDESETPVARMFFDKMKKYVRVEEDNIAKQWLVKRGGFTESEVSNALSGLFKVYDANGDGVLDDVEFGNLMLEIMDAR